MQQCGAGATDSRDETPRVGGFVTNSTVCMDGYVNGWKHWCKENVKDCAQMTTVDLLPDSLITNNTTAVKESSSITPQLIGTWNFVNETQASIGNMSMDYMNNMTGVSGKITFNVNDKRFTQDVSGKNMRGMWINYGNTVYLCYDDVNGPCTVKMTPTTIGANHIALRCLRRCLTSDTIMAK
jgi:hypothetical protein